MNFWYWLVVIFVIVVFAVWKLRKENRASENALHLGEIVSEPEDDEEDEGQESNEWTDPELLARIKAAGSSEDLLSVLGDFDSYDFSDEEDQAFVAKAAELSFSREDWQYVLDAVDGDESYLEEVAEEKAA